VAAFEETIDDFIVGVWFLISDKGVDFFWRWRKADEVDIETFNECGAIGLG
jgi:hypothetical protein